MLAPRPLEPWSLAEIFSILFSHPSGKRPHTRVGDLEQGSLVSF